MGEVKDVISDADYSIVNFECPVTKGGEKPIEKCGPNLQCSEKGMEAAHGRYCWFVDSDDIIAENAFDCLIPLLRTTNKDGIKMGAAIKDVLYNDSFVGNSIYHPVITENTSVSSTSIFEFAHGHQSILFSKKIIEENRIRYPENIHINEDMYFIARFLINSKCFLVNTTIRFYIYRNVEQSLSRGKLKSFAHFDKMNRYRIEILQMMVKERERLVNEEANKGLSIYIDRILETILNSILFSGQPFWIIMYYLKRLKAINTFPATSICKSCKFKIVYSNSFFYILTSQLIRIKKVFS